ncbi:MAG: hypothetical protein EP314_06125 [Bacteroidetes bacterium]|nr:MAG: hypothetical protein EP314_06125 [Bacteroidota bacterium]
MKNELRNVISGKSEVSQGVAVQAALRYLEASSGTGGKAQNSKQVKREEAESLIAFAKANGLWEEKIDLTNYISEGAEQKVYLKDSSDVFKLNDAIYFETWRDYFRNLLLHNFFFPDTAYELIALTEIDGVLLAQVRQPFVFSTSITDLDEVKKFMAENGFINIRNNDYLNSQLGIILEDLHDENVLTSNGILYFIDTVFYLTESFWD